MNNIGELQSKTISFIRFPLIVLIVYIHNQGMGTPLGEVSISWANFSDIDAYNLLRLVITEVIARAAVPSFFILSGYLFFFGKTSFSRETWLKALKKRFWTLFVPFILWNIVASCFTIAFCRIKGLPSGLNFIRIFLNEGNPSTWMDVFGNTHTLCYPLDIPLWYIRDLIVLCVCSPIIYLLVKHVPKLFMVVLFFFAITGYNLDIIGFNYNAFLFFSIGAYFGAYQINLLGFGQRYKLPFLISTIALGVLFVYLRSVRGTLFWINNPFFICFFFSLLVLIATSLERGSVRLHPLLVRSVFFVFALHHMPYFMAFPLPWLKFLPSSTLVFVGDYLLTPIIKISLCLLLYIILDKLSPKINGLLSGNRSK